MTTLAGSLVMEALQESCTAAFPEWEHLRLSAPEELTDGWETVSYAVTAAHDGGQAPLILRAYPGAEGQEKAAKEFKALQRLQDAGFPVPRVEHLALTTPLGMPALLMERIEGANLASALREAAPERRAELLTLFCTTQLRLHQLDWRRFVPDAPPGERVNPYAFITDFLHTIQDDARRCGMADASMLVYVLAWLRARRRDVPCARLAPLHGDYHPGNVLLRPDGTPAVIDWGQFRLGDPRFDLAWTLLLAGTFGHPEQRTDVLARYEEAAGETVEQLAYFEALAAAVRLFTLVVAVTRGADALGMRPAVIARQPDHLAAVYALLRARTGIELPEVDRLLAQLHGDRV